MYVSVQEFSEREIMQSEGYRLRLYVWQELCRNEVEKWQMELTKC